jgi:hypothetical protein
VAISERIVRKLAIKCIIAYLLVDISIIT